jgi:hypothetical protein
MPINHQEIIEEIEAQIRRLGGAFDEWIVGTAKDSRGPFFQRHREADLGDGLAYREAYTTTAAEAVVEHLVTYRGLAIDRAAAPEPGKIVFVYRRTSPESEHRLQVTGYREQGARADSKFKIQEKSCDHLEQWPVKSDKWRAEG